MSNKCRRVKRAIFLFEVKRRKSVTSQKNRNERNTWTVVFSINCVTACKSSSKEKEQRFTVWTEAHLMHQRKSDSFYCSYGNFHWILWKISSTHHSLALLQTRLAACGWLNRSSCLHDWQTNVAVQSALPPHPHHFWCTCKPLPKIPVANSVFSSESPACFKVPSTEEEL